MPVKLRLSRHGRKKFAFYHIVAADGRAPRDGKFIEKLGIYNPNTDPATIELDFDKALDWLSKGAQPTETVRAILSYKGVLIKKHLLEGVRKGAFSEEEAEKRFTAWLQEKEGKIQAKIDRISKDLEDSSRTRLEVETKISEARAAEILKRQSELAEAAEKESSQTEDEEAAVEAEPGETTTEASGEETAEVTEATAESPETGENGTVEDVKEEPAKEDVKEEEAAPEKTLEKEETVEKVKADEKSEVK